MSAEFFEVVRHQRAHRSFAATPVDDDDIAAVLTAATYAPSAENRQPWEFIVVRETSARAALGDLMRRAWDSGGRTFSESRVSPKMLADVERGMTGGFAGAPVFIVACADTERGLEQTVASSMFSAIQNLLFAATARGLGSALTTIAVGFRAELTTLFALPPHVIPVAVVPLGHPARPLGPPRRDAFAAHTHRDRYGERWSAST